MPLVDWAPTVASVGARLRSRTVDTAGNEVGTFNDATRPTGAQVQEILDLSQAEVAAETGIDMPEALRPLATQVAVFGAILDVELTYFPEQVGTSRSAYEEYKVRYDEKLKRLIDSYQEAMAADGVATDADGSLSPSYGFPADAGGMIGHGTVW